ncbi:MAG: hypothetical protein IPK58_25115 [Acidobacteria bacterium]|nr:hypothetical protein [Acidobacteriota bacterium]
MINEEQAKHQYYNDYESSPERLPCGDKQPAGKDRRDQVRYPGAKDQDRPDSAPVYKEIETKAIIKPKGSPTAIPSRPIRRLDLRHLSELFAVFVLPGLLTANQNMSHWQQNKHD